MSTIRYLNAGAPGTGTVTNLMRGLAKAWFLFNQTGTQAITTSLNTSSITDEGLGQTTISFTSAFTGGTYSFTTGNSEGASAVPVFVLQYWDTAPSTSSIRLSCWHYQWAVLYDTVRTNCAINGTLA